MESKVAEHIEKIKPEDVIVTPAHEERKASAEFERNVRRLKAEGHHACFVCGATENIQVHHFGCEWSEAHLCDFEKLKGLLEIFDIYGYAAAMKDEPITSVDDIRNLMALCQGHHTGVDKEGGTAIGIHYLVFPMWVMHCVAKTGEDPIPGQGETLEDAEKRIGKQENGGAL